MAVSAFGIVVVVNQIGVAETPVNTLHFASVGALALATAYLKDIAPYFGSRSG